MTPNTEQSFGALTDSWGFLQLNEVSLRFIFFDGKEAFVQWTKKGTLYGARHLANAMAYAIDDMVCANNYTSLLSITVGPIYIIIL